MNNNKGLSLFEILVVVGILAILSALIAPNLMNWRRGVQLRGAANNLKGDLELARTSAIRENNHVAVIFRDALNYEIFVDNGAGDEGNSENWIRDGDERLLRSREMPAGVEIDIGNTKFGTGGAEAIRRTRFNGRGHCARPGSTYVQNEANDRIKVILNRLGQITMEKQ
jgi:prepilin-type N-terminal cleavage/methylation domain-containing protein